MKKIINIKWMHCVSCEILLEKQLQKIHWVKVLKLSYRKWILEVEYKHNSDYDQIVKTITKNWYKVVKNSEKNENSNNNLLSNIIAVLFVIIFIIIWKLFNLYQYLPETNTLSYSWAFLVWIIASLSTCLAIVWWIIIWFSKYIDSSNSRTWNVKVQLWFQIWRLLWFFLLWWILWLLGKLISISLSFSSILTFFIWILLLYMWLNILWILPSLSRYWINMPKSFAGKIEKLWKPQYSPMVWAMTFFLPCWFTQTMQLLAVSSWSFISWWLVMLFFALWTFPVLFSIWVWTSYIKDKKIELLNKIVAWILIVFWITTISNSYNLLWVSASSITQKETTTCNIQDSESCIDSQSLRPNSDTEKNNTNLVSNVDSAETIKVWHNGWSMEPEKITLKKWKNYKIVVTPTSDWKWCMATQLIPKLNTKVSRIQKWVPIVYEINNAKPWTYEIVCWTMWMLQWKIVVE